MAEPLETLRETYINLGIENDRYPNGKATFDIMRNAVHVSKIALGDGAFSDSEWNAAANEIMDEVSSKWGDRFMRIPEADRGKGNQQ